MNDELAEALKTAVTLPNGYFTRRPYTSKVWTVWNQRKYQREYNRSWFGASAIAWKITNLYRTERAVWEIETVEHWIDCLRDNLTDEDWVALENQASHLWTFFSPEERVAFPYETAVQFVIRKIIIDTHDGLYREHRAKWECLMNCFPGLTWRYATPSEDSDTGFDLFGHEGGDFRVAVSVKPASYVKSTNPGMDNNKHKEHQKHERWLGKHVGAIAFQLTDGNDGWVIEPVFGRLCAVCHQVSSLPTP